MCLSKYFFKFSSIYAIFFTVSSVNSNGTVFAYSDSMKLKVSSSPNSFLPSAVFLSAPVGAGADFFYFSKSSMQIDNSWKIFDVIVSLNENEKKSSSSSNEYS